MAPIWRGRLSCDWNHRHEAGGLQAILNHGQCPLSMQAASEVILHDPYQSLLHVVPFDLRAAKVGMTTTKVLGAR